ncbi:hypothetical protein [Elizabethkingia anophelis]|uniref:hypothetical protein n=1 Tax=Elizabethkingia anophelis TaxID=1117645 RepID=UPI000442B39D|nr:hypothetical protein [Elizabethkingia anophelis]CDN74278.1 hypothetical protein E18064_290142 [Elizabethkingia anophelis]CDN78107.1 hypothetical protein E27107_280142 [Elizabethkingia anophelis]
MNENMDAFDHFDYFRYLDDDDSLAEIKRETMLECRILEDNNMISIDYLTGIYKAHSYDFETNESFINIVDISDIIGIYLEGEKSDIIISEFDKEFKAYIQKGQDVEILLNNLKFLLKDLSKREYDNFNKPSYIYRALDKISNHIKKKYGFDCELNFDSSNLNIPISEFTPLSYHWKSSNTEKGRKSLKKLYTQLSESKFIQCSEDTFVKAFTCSKIDEGIKWCVMAKNTFFSKQSLIKFIDYLMDSKLIDNKISKEFNSSLAYVFRDNKGDVIENISVSKSSLSETPSGWNEIKTIIDNL